MWQNIKIGETWWRYTGVYSTVDLFFYKFEHFSNKKLEKLKPEILLCIS